MKKLKPSGGEVSCQRPDSWLEAEQEAQDARHRPFPAFTRQQFLHDIKGPLAVKVSHYIFFPDTTKPTLFIELRVN